LVIFGNIFTIYFYRSTNINIFYIVTEKTQKFENANSNPLCQKQSITPLHEATIPIKSSKYYNVSLKRKEKYCDKNCMKREYFFDIFIHFSLIYLLMNEL